MPISLRFTPKFFVSPNAHTKKPGHPASQARYFITMGKNLAGRARTAWIVYPGSERRL
ncbi:protein of unknown function [Hyphomicrobium sp. MC1]|nr:protein of unknown function [Hyphomicrobium sp. MC1]